MIRFGKVGASHLIAAEISKTHHPRERFVNLRYAVRVDTDLNAGLIQGWE